MSVSRLPGFGSVPFANCNLHVCSCKLLVLNMLFKISFILKTRLSYNLGFLKYQNLNWSEYFRNARRFC